MLPALALSVTAATATSSASPPASNAAERELLLGCARVHLCEAAHERLRTLLAQEQIDWDVVLEQAQRHRVWLLVHRHLCGPLAGAVPDAVRRRLASHARTTAFHNLTRTQELLQLADQMEAAGIPVLVLKGPALGAQVYGGPALRQFGDLDVLVPRNDADRAQHLLADRGYHPYASMTEAEAREHFALEKSREFVRERTVVELHWDLLHPMHGVPFDAAALRERAVWHALGGSQLRMLSPEDLVIYLCAHGSKHFWERLSWICDVAECLRTYQDAMDWAVVQRRAGALHAHRMLLLGTRLAAHLLDAPLPERLLRQAMQDRAVGRLAVHVRTTLFRRAGAHDARFDEARTEMEHARFHLLMRERLRDRLPYYRHLARLAMTPTERDEDMVALPRRLSFLYYALRPVRLLCDAVENGLRRLRT